MLWKILIFVFLAFTVGKIILMLLMEIFWLCYYWYHGYKPDHYFPVFGAFGLRNKHLKEKGDALYFLKEAVQKDQNKKFILSNAAGKAQFFLLDEQMISDFYANQLENYTKDSELLWNLMRVLGNGLLFSEGSDWKHQRKVLSDAFHFESIKKMTPIVLQTIQDNFDELIKSKKFKGVNMTHEIEKIAGDVICRTFFGKDFSKQEIDGQPISLALADFVIKVNWQFLHNPLVWIFGMPIMKLGITKMDRFVNRTNQRFRELARQTLEYRSKNIHEKFGKDQERRDFLQVIFEHNEKNPNAKLSEENIISQFMTFFLAGMDTTGHATGMAVYYFVKYPHVLAEVKKEFAALGKKVEDLNIEDLAQLKYLDAFFKETLRMGTPVNFIAPRVATKTHNLGNVTIKKGMSVTVGIGANNFNEKYFDQPHEFRPERWLNEQEVKKQGTYAYIPFSAGPRNCIGKYLANTEAKLILLYFIHKFKFELTDENYQLRMAINFVYEPAEEIKYNLQLIS